LGIADHLLRQREADQSGLGSGQTS
jgi:hypothetical protein